MNKIALIIPYFGRWPEWFELYLYSCSRQQMIDFIFFTDCEKPAKTFINTIFYEMCFGDYCKRVSAALNIDFHPERPYKLCDLKPFYGIIHERELKNYDWWGFGDIDLVYGDLAMLVNERNLNRYDILTTHADRVAGHFTLIRKASRYTTMPLQIPKWQEMLCSEQNFGMDENAYSRLVMSWKYKMIGRIYHHGLYRWTKPDNKHKWFYRLENLFRFVKSNVLMHEFFTTFKPTPATECYYIPAKNEIYITDNQPTINSGGVKSTFIFSFSRKRSIGTQSNIGVMDSIKYQKGMTSILKEAS